MRSLILVLAAVVAWAGFLFLVLQDTDTSAARDVGEVAPVAPRVDDDASEYAALTHQRTAGSTEARSVLAQGGTGKTPAGQNLRHLYNPQFRYGGKSRRVIWG